MNEISSRWNIAIRFADIDVMGHVNNAVYLSYFEQARVHFFEEHLQQHWDWRKAGVVIARHEIDYLAPLYLNDKAFVETWISRMGTKSYDMSYRIVKASTSGEQLICKGSTVLVAFDHNTGKSQQIPLAFRNLVRA
jgi:acyl-CoA thioester hydrolase